MSIRRKRRRRGKRRALRNAALKTWEKLTATRPQPLDSGMLINRVRKTYMNILASQIVNVQPMQPPVGMIANIAMGLEPILESSKVRYDITKKAISKQRKTERKDKKRKRTFMAKTYQDVRQISNLH